MEFFLALVNQLREEFHPKQNKKNDEKKRKKRQEKLWFSKR
jgi:hypothetical protein